VLRARWLGRVRYDDAHALQRALFARAGDDYLLLLEHPHVYTLGVRARAEHVLVRPESVGAELVRADRGGDVTYHGPGQLVGYPIVDLGLKPDVGAYLRGLEGCLIDVLAGFGISAARLPGFTGVWIEGERKIAAIGIKVASGITTHGFALNVSTDLSLFAHILPCGIRDKGVTSMARELGRAPDMAAVEDAVAARFPERFLVPGPPGVAVA